MARAMRILGVASGLTVAVLAGTPVFAGEAPPPAVTRITDTIHVAVVEDRNTPFLIEGGRVLLADTNFDRNAEAVQGLLAQLTPDPVTLVFNSHWHPDHVGGNAFFAAQGAITLAHENTLTRMAGQQLNPTTGQVQAEAFAPEFLPIVTFRDTMDFQWGAEKMHLAFYPDAHTDSDVVLYFETSNVVYIGGLLNYPTYAGVYRVDGFLAALDAVLAKTDAETRIIPWRGPVIGRGEVEEWRNIVATVGMRVEALITEGKTIEEAVAAAPSAEFDAKWGGQRAPARFVEDVYVALTSAE
jgi:cyclase